MSNDFEDIFKENKNKVDSLGIDDEDEVTYNGNIPDELRANTMRRDEVLKKVQEDGMFLQYTYDKYKDDLEVIAYAVKNNATAFIYASENLKTDKDVAKFFINLKKEEMKKPQQENEDRSMYLTRQHFYHQEMMIIHDINKKAIKEKNKRIEKAQKRLDETIR